jgi:3-hydroxyacyl-[acyl-carrier-protein] dehydratase
MWIDRIVELVPRQRLVALKHVSLAEEHLHDHFPATTTPNGEQLPPLPVMPACFIIEGMAQTAGVLVGHASAFKEKVILAKVSKAELHEDVPAGFTLRYTATVQNLDAVGASTVGTVELLDPGQPGCPARHIGTIDLMFSHIDQNLAGTEFPSHNFVFGESFQTLLRTSGIAF